MLDVKMWMEEVDDRRQLLYEHYTKDMATKAMINAKPSLSKKTRRTVLTQEMLQILLHCSPNLPWETVRDHCNRFMIKLQ